MGGPRFQRAADLLDDWRPDGTGGVPPTTYPLGAGFERLEVGPGLVTLVGGAPGAGKLALVMQWATEALARTGRRGSAPRSATWRCPRGCSWTAGSPTPT